MIVTKAFLTAAVLASATPAPAPTLTPGLYRTANGTALYLGLENSPPAPVVIEFFDPSTQRFGLRENTQGLTLERPVTEERRIIHAPQGDLGVSFYRADDRKRAVMVLVHGNDNEGREMGFLIPYFVLNGINVITYDQRGLGDSSGNWQMNGPVQRAGDVETIIDAYRSNSMIDASRIGLWGFSNGGWTVPYVAAHRKVAFMILKSPSAETIRDNVRYSVKQRMLVYGHSENDIRAALATLNALYGVLDGTTPVEEAKRIYGAAQKQAWFKDSLLPGGLPLPMPKAMMDGYRRATSYDPGQTLRTVRVPTLALFGAEDRNVDQRHASRTMLADFRAAGMKDFTMHVFPRAGHMLISAADGFHHDKPERVVAGYPQIMIDWLKARGYTAPSRVAN